MFQINSTYASTALLICPMCLYAAAVVCSVGGFHRFRRVSSSAMTPCVEVVLSWAIGGGEVQRWHAPINSFLDDVVSEEFLESLPGEVEVIHGQNKLQRPLHIELRMCVGSDKGCLLLGLVRTQAFKHDERDLMPYLCTDGTTAVRIPELGTRFTFPRSEPERFSHAYAAMAKQFCDEGQTHIGRQVVDLIKREFPGCVLRRKLPRFFCDINGMDSPLAIRCVLVLDANKELLLRIDTCWFDMVDDDAAAAEMKTAADSIYAATFL